jgi:hypothetical protein
MKFKIYTYECLICGDHIDSDEPISLTKICEGCENGVYKLISVKPKLIQNSPLTNTRRSKS